MIGYDTSRYHCLIKKLHHMMFIDLKIQNFLLVFCNVLRNGFCYFVNHMMVLVSKYKASGIDTFF